MDRMRASDVEREAAVSVLRTAAAEGRLSVEELDERTATAYAATTRGELSAVLDDIPTAALPAPRPSPARKLPRVPGRLGFSARWRAPVRRVQAAADLIEFVAPPLHASGYEMESATEERLVFVRDVRPAWTWVVTVAAFPIGMIALLHTTRERVVIELLERGDETVIIAQGTAPLRIRRGLTELER